MDAEQIRDSLLSVSGALDSKMGGPSEPLAPSSRRRTVYAKVSRYKLDDYLQLFDFPSPNLSAEKPAAVASPAGKGAAGINAEPSAVMTAAMKLFITRESRDPTHPVASRHPSS